MELVRAGINVLTAVNIQHLESLNDLVTRMTGVPIRETVPDSFLAQADQVVNIDLSVEDLRDRLQAGKIYPPEKINAALENFFSEANLAGLRELALREVAENAQREARSRATPSTPQTGAGAPAKSATGRVMLALSSGATNGAALIRKGSRIAGRLNTHWYVAHVERPGETASTMDSAALRRLADAFELAQELGAEVVRLKGDDISRTLLSFARQNGVERILLGRSQRGRLRQRLFGSLVSRVIDGAEGLDVQVLSTGARTEEHEA
jgi:two-component system sensor histidine kinase KdpD